MCDAQLVRRLAQILVVNGFAFENIRNGVGDELEVDMYG
jgi:hypothetical protein